MYTYPIDYTLLPTVIIKWSTVSGYKYLECQSGTAPKEVSAYSYTHYNSRTNTFMCSANSTPYFAYLKYHEDSKLLEVAQVTINTSRKEVARNWEYAGERYFIAKDKTVYDINGNVKTTSFVLNKYETLRDFKAYLHRLMYQGRTRHISELRKLIGSDYISNGSGRITFITYAWHFEHWYITNSPKKTKTKNQKLIDEISAIELSNQHFDEIKQTDDYYQSTCYYIVYFEKANTDWDVLRIMHLNDGRTYTETNRIYISKDNVIATVKIGDNWITCRQYNIPYQEIYFVNKNEAIEQCKRIKYIAGDNQNIGYNELIAALRFTEVEQMIKLGCTDVVKNASRSHYVKSELKGSFGGYYNDKEKNFLKKVAMTKPQIDYIMKAENVARYYNRSSALKMMRELLGYDLSRIDQASFEKYYSGCNSAYNYFSSDYYTNIIAVNRVKFIKNLIRLGEKQSTVYQVARDTISQYSYLDTGTRPEINWYFDSISDLTRAHDALTALANAQREERNAYYRMQTAERHKKEQEKMEKLDKERKAWEYEDDQYIIRLPKNIAEIVIEGSKQRICIGGYTTSHALGHTNLFFLRKKDDEDSPFYAIEMDNDKIIRQIHGYANRWLGCNPEAIPTVIRWLRKNNFKCDEKILTCTATGYGSNRQYVPMPKVD